MESIFSYIIGLGAAVMMPVIFTILGVCIGIKFSKALKSGLYVGVGFVGLGIYIPPVYYKGDSHFTDGKPRLPNQAYVQIVGTETDSLHYWFTATSHIESFGFSNKDAWFEWLKKWKDELASPILINKE